MIWNIIGIAIIVCVVVFSDLAWYISLPVGIAAAAIVVFIGGMIKGKINQ